MLTTEIKNKEDLIRFFQDNPNPYSSFILSIIDRDPETLGSGSCHRHHMIPLHAGGPDKPFNLILLTVEEHITAHQLLFDAYGSFYDLGAVNMLTGLFKIGEANIRKANQEKMKKKVFLIKHFKQSLQDAQKNKERITQEINL